MKSLSEQSSMGRLLATAGVEDWDELYKSICEGCAVHEFCSAKGKRCRAAKVIAAIVSIGHSCYGIPCLLVKMIREADQSIARGK